MNQQDLADAVAKAIGVDKAEAAKAVAAVLDTIQDNLKRGEKIAIGASAASRRCIGRHGRGAILRPARWSRFLPAS